MKLRSRVIGIFTLLFGYVLVQFLWWEILLVRQTGTIINEKQKLAELTISDDEKLGREIAALHHKKKMQTLMIVCEGTVFLLLLIYGAHRVRKSHQKEIAVSSQQKNFFLSITHELKTPIAATRLQLQTMRRKDLGDIQRDALIESALQENERLNALIDNVLLATRFETGEYTFSKSNVDLSELVRSIAERYYKAELENGSLRLDLSRGITIHADVQSIPSIVTNLIDNALKYSGPQKRVIVALSGGGGKVKLAVSDEGFGVAAADRGEIFKRFYRAGSPAVKAVKGTGLGLYIVSYIAMRHNATVSVRDNKPAGSVFEVIFDVV